MPFTSQLVIHDGEQAWAPSNGPSLPQGTDWLFLDPNGDLVAVSPSGPMRLQGDPADAKDGTKVLGTTPLTLRDLAADPQILTFQMEGHDPVRRTAIVEPGSTVSVIGVMSRNVGAIVLATQPAGCSVFLNRELVGKTRRSENEQVSRDFRIPELKDGTMTVAVTHPLYFPEKRQVTVRKGETSQVGVIRLRKRWIPDFELTKRQGGSVKGVLIQRNPDGSIMFEESKGIRITYKKHEILRLRPLELPTEDVGPPQ